MVAGLPQRLAWWCPQCGRATVTTYRCSNYDCATDLAGEHLEPITPAAKAMRRGTSA